MNIYTADTNKLNQYEVIPIIADMIVQKIAPQKIVLFGSCAKKCITRASDIDLCIVMEEQVSLPQRIKIRSDLLQAILDITDYEVDLYICGADEWQRHHNNSGVMIGKISREGELLYGR